MRVISDEGETAKRRRDPERTREDILEASVKLLAADGPEGLSVSKLAQIVGINRGTAYHHFQTRKQLLAATIQWVSEKLSRETFGDEESCDEKNPLAGIQPRVVTENLIKFAIENPEYGRVWLVSILNSSDPDKDPYWSRYKALMDYFIDSDLAQPGIDAEVHSILIIVGTMLWPVWKKSGQCSDRERNQLVERFTNEIMRYNSVGVFKKGLVEKLDALVKK